MVAINGGNTGQALCALRDPAGAVFYGARIGQEDRKQLHRARMLAQQRTSDDHRSLPS